MQKPQHALRLREVSDDIGHRVLLRRGERVGERGNDAAAQASFGGTAAAAARAHMRAKESERELPGEEFIVCEPRPSRAFGRKIVRRLRVVQPAQRLGKIRIGIT